MFRHFLRCQHPISLPCVVEIADVPHADEKGDFMISRVMGHLGEYHQILWIVIDCGPDGLNCRRALRAQLASVSFDYGSILIIDNSGPPGDAIELYNDQLWLRVSVSSRQMKLIFDHRPLSDRRRTFSCLDRANADSITPINMSACEVQRQRDIPFIPVPMEDSHD